MLQKPRLNSLHARIGSSDLQKIVGESVTPMAGLWERHPTASKVADFLAWARCGLWTPRTRSGINPLSLPRGVCAGGSGEGGPSEVYRKALQKCFSERAFLLSTGLQINCNGNDNSGALISLWLVPQRESRECLDTLPFSASLTAATAAVLPN